MPHLDRGDARVHYVVSGDGPPLLLIAGLMSDSASWAPLLPLLEPHFTVIRPDNRSTGQTTPWDAPCSVPIWAEDAVAVLDALGIERAHVHGHSLGGLIAWHLAAATPQRVQSLVIAGRMPRMLPRNAALFNALLSVRRSNAPPETWLRLLFPWLFHPQVFDDPAQIDSALAQSLAYPHAQSVEAMAHQLEALTAIDLPEVPNVPMRALLAENDLLIPMATAQEQLLNVETHIIQNAGHSVHWDNPNAVAAHILELAEATE